MRSLLAHLRQPHVEYFSRYYRSIVHRGMNFLQPCGKVDSCHSKAIKYKPMFYSNPDGTL
jgi:hypothetical protein